MSCDDVQQVGMQRQLATLKSFSYYFGSFLVVLLFQSCIVTALWLVSKHVLGTVGTVPSSITSHPSPFTPSHFHTFTPSLLPSHLLVHHQKEISVQLVPGSRQMECIMCCHHTISILLEWLLYTLWHTQVQCMMYSYTTYYAYHLKFEVTIEQVIKEIKAFIHRILFKLH